MIAENVVRIKREIRNWINVKSKIQKTSCVCKRLYPTACASEINRYLKSITDGEVIGAVTKSYNEP